MKEQELQQEPISQELLDEMEEQAAEQAEDMAENQYELNQELQEAYGGPEHDEKLSQHAFLHKAAFESGDTTRTTWLSEWELGKPLFSVRFLLDMEDISHHYLDPFCKTLKVPNKIALYFKEKVHNITDSGMSNKGFAMNLNVTKKMDAVRRRVRELPPELKGGKKI